VLNHFTNHLERLSLVKAFFLAELKNNQLRAF